MTGLRHTCSVTNPIAKAGIYIQSSLQVNFRIITDASSSPSPGNWSRTASSSLLLMGGLQAGAPVVASLKPFSH